MIPANRKSEKPVVSSNFLYTIYSKKQQWQSFQKYSGDYGVVSINIENADVCLYGQGPIS